MNFLMNLTYAIRVHNMKKICKNCEWWKRESDMEYGRCELMDGEWRWTDDCHIWDWSERGGWSSGQNFGCIHWKEKPYPNVGV